MKKRIVALMLCLLCVCGLAGCSLLTKRYTFSAEENSIYVHADGQITAAIIEDFSKDYYDLEELTGLAQQQVLEYNRTKYALEYFSYDQLTKDQKKEMLLPVSLEAVETKDSKVILTFRYANGDAFTGFNGIDIQNGGGTTVYTSEIGESRMALEGTFVAAKGGEIQDNTELASKTDYELVYVDYATRIYFEHEISYVSSNVAVLSGNCVQTQGGQGSYIIFK